jgi:hypothetical protein
MSFRGILIALMLVLVERLRVSEFSGNSHCFDPRSGRKGLVLMSFRGIPIALILVLAERASFWQKGSRVNEFSPDSHCLEVVSA